MRYAKVKDGIIIDVITGIAPNNYKPILKKWTKPRDYPGIFYTADSNKPIVSIEGDELHENWSFTLKSIEGIKDTIYEKLEKIRYIEQIGDVDFDGDIITLKDRDDAININTLGPTASTYKGKRRNWVRTPAKISLLKTAVLNHVQSAYDEELAECDLVEAMTTEDELKTYYDSM